MACSSPCERADDLLAQYGSSHDWENIVQEMNKFNFAAAFGTTNMSPVLSSPPSTTFSGSSGSSASSSGLLGLHDSLNPNFTWDAPSSCLPRLPNDLNTPLATPSFESCDGWRVDLNQTSSLFSPSSQERSSSQEWPHTPKSSPFGSIDATNTFIADIESSPTMRWGHAGSTPIAHPSPTATYQDARFGNESVAAQLQNELAYKQSGTCNPGLTTIDPSVTIASGLMIQIPHSPVPQSCIIPHGLPALSHHRSSGSLNSSYNNPRPRQASEAMPRPQERQRQGSMALRRPKTRCASTTMTAKGLAGSGPYHVSKRHASTSVGRGVDMTPRSARLPSSSGDIGFVNFTPNDSKKILTGVAPSGSSKTKARREKEAQEKRKKLSQAAMKAVQDAGGDVNRLIEEGLFGC